MADSIITLPKAPDISMTVETTVYSAKAQIRRNVGNYSSLYLEGTIINAEGDIGPGESMSLGQWQAGVIATDSILHFTGTKGTDTTELDITSLLVLDQSFDSVVLSVPSSGVTAKIGYIYQQL